MMQTFIALLRAVNVGGTGKLPMADLRDMAKTAGLTDVRSYIQSGNLVFTSPEKAPEVQALLEAPLTRYAGKPQTVLIRSAADMQSVLDQNPFPNAEPAKVGVLFLPAPSNANGASQIKGQSDEEIATGAREIFIHFPSGMGRSKLRLPEMSTGTMRNLNTVRKLVEMATETS